jgi:hypothetical protein
MLSKLVKSAPDHCHWMTVIAPRAHGEHPFGYSYLRKSEDHSPRARTNLLSTGLKDQSTRSLRTRMDEPGTNVDPINIS